MRVKMQALEQTGTQKMAFAPAMEMRSLEMAGEGHLESAIAPLKVTPLVQVA